MNDEPTAKPLTQNTRWNIKAILGASLLLVPALGGLLWLALPQKEPEYQGKPLRYWLERAQNIKGGFSNPKDPEVIECTDAIRQIGTNAIPLLLRMLKAKDSALKTKVLDFADRKNFTNFPFCSAEEQNYKAAIGLYLLGNLASNAIPGLIEIYAQPSSPLSKEMADRLLICLYPAPGVSTPYWVPTAERAQWYLEAGEIRSQLGESSNAILVFSEAIKLNPTNGEAYLSRGNARVALQDFAGATVDFEKVLELSPNEETAYYSRGVCKYGLKDFKGAEADFTTSISLNSNDLGSYIYRGSARAQLRELTSALADFNKAIELSPQYAAAYRGRAMVEGLQKEYELALADAEKSIDINNKDPATFTFRGRIKNALKDYKAAVLDFDTAIELDPKNADAYASRGLSWVYMDDFNSAATDLEKVLQFNSKSVAIFVASGLLKAKRGGEEAASLADFERAVELGAEVPETHVMLGLFQYK